MSARFLVEKQNADSTRIRAPRHWLITWLVCLLAIAVFASPAPAAETSTSLFRIGFSSAILSDVNENDALAALKVWAGVVVKERGIPMDPLPLIMNGVETIAQAMRSQTIDAVALATDEYWNLRDVMDSNVFICGVNEGAITEEYVLLVHQDSLIKHIDDLRGHSLSFYHNSRMSLACIWLDTVLVQGGFPRTAEFCRLTQTPKLSNALLPVFFRQTDACVVTRRGFNIMNELNPQISQQLKVLAASPELVPSGFCFRRDYNGPLRETLIKGLGKITSTPAGAQILTLFQSGSLEAHPLSCLDSAFELLAKHRQLCGETSTTPMSKTTSETIEGAN